MTALDATPPAAGRSARGRTRLLPVAERVELLLAEMTLEEKVAPARQPLGRQRHAGRRRRAAPRTPTRDGTQNVAPMQDVFAAAGHGPASRRRAGTGSAT